jgi:hypothetical protein
MKSSESKVIFDSRLKALGQRPCPKDAIGAMIIFYRDVRADDCTLDQDGDMLLFQWGTHVWDKIKWIEINISRHFVLTGGEDDNNFQLTLTMRFPSSPGSDNIKPGNRWCGLPAEIDAFKKFIVSLALIQKMRNTPCEHMALEYYKTG